MPAFLIQLSQQPFLLRAADANLLAHFIEYFRYYQPASVESLSAPANALTLDLQVVSVTVTPPVAATEKLAQTGIVSLWRTASTPETLWLCAGDTTFEIVPEEARAIGYIGTAALALPPILTNTYSLFALLLLLRWRGVYHLHAAAVCAPDERLYWLAGAQRSGKTTLVTALGLAGWRPLADDSLLLSWPDAQPVWQPLRKAFHLSLAALAHWQTRLTGLHSQPRYLDRHSSAALEFFQTQTLAEQTFSHVHGLLFPQVLATAQTRIEPLSPSEALRRLAEQSTFFPLWPNHTQRQFQALSHYATNVKSFAVMAGADVLDEPERVAEILRDALGQ